MPVPTVAARSTYAATANTTTHTPALSGLGTIAAGDGLVMGLAVDGGDVISSIAGWTILMQDEPETSIRIGIAYKVAAGSDADPLITLAGPEKIGVLLWRMEDVDFATDPPQAPSTAATGISTNPDPASFTPTGGAIDRLWLAIAGNDDDDATTGYPADYTNTATAMSVGSGGVNIGAAERQLATASADAGSFTIEASEAWAAVMVSIVGVAGSGPVDGAVALAGAGDLTATGIVGSASTGTLAFLAQLLGV